MQFHDKKTIRKNLLVKRRQLSLTDQEQKSAQIIAQIKHCEIFSQATKIATYHAVRGEADPAELIKIAPKNTQFFLPVISPDNKQHLLFAPVNSNTRYKNNSFLILEPIVNPNEYISATDLDLVIMPLLSFDWHGNRLGMGGGYYDRTFAFKKHAETKPILMGFAYDFQEVVALKPEPWDVGLDLIATESTLRRPEK